MGKETPERCPRCGSPDVKVYPQDFASSKWPLTVVPWSAKLAGGPEPSQPILVCISCSHNVDLA